MDKSELIALWIVGVAVVLTILYFFKNRGGGGGCCPKDCLPKDKK